MKKSVAVFIFICTLISLQINAQTWSALKRLTWTSEDSRTPSIAFYSYPNPLHFVWSERSPGRYEIFHKIGTNFGETWSTPKRLTWTSGGSNDPVIAAHPSSGIHIVYCEYISPSLEILYKRSSTGGSTWTPPARMTWNAGASEHPAIAAAPNKKIHIVWDDETPQNDKEIYYRKSTDEGATWSSLKRLTWSTGWSGDPSIAADSANGIHVVWRDQSPGYPSLFYKRSTDDGATWSALTRLKWNTGEVLVYPCIIADSSNVLHLVWYDRSPGNSEIFYRRSTDLGVSWSAIKRLTWNSDQSWSPTIAVDSSNGLHVVWSEGKAFDFEIVYKNSTDSGLSWSASELITWNTGFSYFPAVASDPLNFIYVVWQDKAPGNYEIFHKSRK